MNILRKIAGWSVAAALVCSAQAAEWCTDFAAALKRAGAENKLVLADFTGSDWCYYCIRLRADVLDNPRFAAWADSHFVLLEIDLLENPAFDQAKLKQNRELCARYGVDSYPTVLVLSDTGEPLGGFFGYVSDPAAVQKELAAALRVASLLRQARSLSDGDSAITVTNRAISLQSPVTSMFMHIGRPRMLNPSRSPSIPTAATS